MIAPEVMLATGTGGRDPEAIIAAHPGWSWEIKYDGIRALILREDNQIRILNRRRIDITHRYPDVVQAVRTTSGRWNGVLDGEIIVPGPGGRPDFPLAHFRDAQGTPAGVRAAQAKAPATFLPFDVLHNGRDDLRSEPYRLRKRVLAEITQMTPVLDSEDGPTMWRFVQERNLEGLVGKRPDSAYRGGRHPSWVKVKLTKRLSALVSGATEPGGSRTGFGALLLALWNPQEAVLVDVGKVGSGFTEADLREIPDLLSQRIPVVAEVEYLDISPSGQLRNPVFRGIRRDVDPASCTVDTLHR